MIAESPHRSDLLPKVMEAVVMHGEHTRVVLAAVVARPKVGAAAGKQISHRVQVVATRHVVEAAADVARESVNVGV